MGIQFLDAQSLASLGAMPGPVRDCCQVPAFSPDGRWLAAVDPQQTRVTLFDVSTGRPIRPLVRTTKPSISALGGPTLDTVSYAPNGRWVASNINQRVVVVDPTTGASVMTLPTPDYVEWVMFSPDSRLLMASSDDGSVTMWRTDDWTQQWRRRIDQQITAPAAFSPDGSILVVGSQSGQIHVLDASSGEARRAPLLAHASWMSSLSFSPDGILLASNGIDGHTLLWDAQTGRQVGEPFVTPSHSISTFGPDGVLYVNTYDDVYRIDVAPADLVARACTIAGRSLSDGEWQRYLPDRPRDDACAHVPSSG
jgi:WD40 repeat protein